MSKPTLSLGDRGSDVRQLQMMLRAAGKRPGVTDGIFGANVEAAVVDFQDDFDELDVDGIVGPATWGALEQALEDSGDFEEKPLDIPKLQAIDALVCPDAVEHGFRAMVKTLTSYPVRYGPGRGLFDDDTFKVTYGPGGLNKKDWRNELGSTFPSFHCSSFTNWFMGWISRRNEDFRHAGNIPSLFKMCQAPPTDHYEKGIGTWTGYSDICRTLYSRYQSSKRVGMPDAQNRILDVREILERRTELPSFLIWAQCTNKGGKWKWWHHVGLWFVDHRTPGTPCFRIAADGYNGRNGYSGTPMRFTAMDDAYASMDKGTHIYRAYALDLDPEDVDYSRPLKGFSIEGT